MTIAEYIERSGVKKKYIASNLGIKSATLANKISGKRQWKAEEIYGLSKTIGVPVDELVTAAVGKE